MDATLPDEPVDLGEMTWTHTISSVSEFRLIVSDNIEPGKLYATKPGVPFSDLLRPNPLGGYLTEGGLAEAGWFVVGTLDSIT